MDRDELFARAAEIGRETASAAIAAREVSEHWANRLQANDPKVRATAEAALVQGAPRSLPLLRRFLK